MAMVVVVGVFVGVVVREFCGLKGFGSAWASVLRKLMRDLGITPCRANRYVWMRKEVNTSNIGATTDDGFNSG